MHLAPAQIVDRGVPLLVKSLARIGMLVERGAIEVGQSVRVGGKVSRHPVEDHAGARVVAAIDEAGERVRLAEVGVGREFTEYLVGPGGAGRGGPGGEQ